MIAGVDEASSLSKLQANEMYKQNLLTPTQISNYCHDLWSGEDGEESPELLNSPESSDDEEEEETPVTEAVIEGPPGIVTFNWVQTGISEAKL